MLDPSQTVLLGTAASLAVVHTLLGIDHSLPFVALSRARQWSLSRTLVVTTICGVGHVASSVAIGVIGIGLGVAAESMAWLESRRGDWAAALLFGFGLVYLVRAGWRHARAAPHTHARPNDLRGLTAWALFLVFVLGPCEPLIPLMVVPGVNGHWGTVAAVVGVFGGLTIAVMAAVVTLGYRGLGWMGGPRLGVHADVVAGAVVAASGAAVLWLGM